MNPDFIESSAVIDWKTDAVQALATCLPDVSPDQMTRIGDSVSIKPIVPSG